MKTCVYVTQTPVTKAGMVMSLFTQTGSINSDLTQFLDFGVHFAYNFGGLIVAVTPITQRQSQKRLTT